MFLSNWRLILGGLGVLAVLGGFLYIRHAVIQNGELKTELKEAYIQLEECQQVHKLEEEVSNEFQDKNARLRKQLNSLKRVQSCVPVSQTPEGSGGTATGKELSGRDGLGTEFLYDFAGRCEETRLKLLGCQKLCQ